LEISTMARSPFVTLAALLLLVPTAWSGDALPSTAAAKTPRIPDAWIREALEAAGPNRGELEKALAHFEGDQAKRTAMRFLIANMPGKGYIVTALRDKQGETIPWDPLAYADLAEAHRALDGIEARHGEIDFARDKKIEDVRTITAAFLIRHVDLAFEAWQRMPAAKRVDFNTFLDQVLPYRGSQEPVDPWLQPLMRRYAGRAKAVAGGKLTPKELYAWLSDDIHKRFRFDERYYLHPTDQSFTEMGRSGQGRCEDITNMITFAARSLALATAADYTPYWAHRDNNHAWNVLLDAQGHGFDKAQAHAAKIYRKTFAIQRESLPFRLPAGREAPNRFMASTTARDVTAEYMPTTTVTVELDAKRAGDERHAYLCVFNGGAWKAIAWGSTTREADQAGVRATFQDLGRNVVYLPAVHDGTRLIPAAPPFLLHTDGHVERLPGEAAAAPVTAIAVSPRKVSPDTFAATPVNFLKPGAAYVLKRWSAQAGDWQIVRRITAQTNAPRFEDLPADGLYWLVQDDGKTRRLERVWTIGPRGFQRWW